ncbi:SHOCT domain-containing protein [Candidatus Uhrbacteria bacterium]|nr:SHOCT domain-containing protein [Candidatus Uhrbacteria bacterium]
MMGFFGDWTWASWMWLPMILWWGLVILAVVALVRWMTERSGSAREKSEREILEERYARGEVSKEEFEEKRRALRS